MLRNPPLAANRQRGIMLLEALIGILIFSIGILAMVGLQALSISHVADAKYRSDASLLANAIVSQIWVDRANLANYVYPGGTAPALATWVTNVNASLPGSDAANAPTIAVVAATGQVTITIRWQPPSDPAVHNYQVNALVSGP